ncbi:MAG: CoA-binding protein [Candidatus Lokiarchaeota archaeon]|nr:CoA-binding protein [Candidatus Lokiarchaeota archaeon]
MSDHFLHDFLRPKSIAIYGANNTFGTTMGTMLLLRIVNSNFKGKIFPIHLRLDIVLGYKAYKKISDVPEVPDLVIIVLPPKVVPQVFKECGEKGVKKIVLISGGFRELVGDRTNNLTEEIIKIANFYGIRFTGPNCLGVYNSWIYPEGDGKLNTMMWREQSKRSKFSMASQSGTLASQLWLDPEYPDFNAGKSISLGNEANIDLVDFLEYFKDDDETEVIGLYIEEIKRGKRFINTAKEITPKKPIITIYGGGSEAGNRAIRSHTGSIGANLKIFDAMIKETGIIKTDNIEEFLDISSMLLTPDFPYPKGNRIGIITHSGGPGALIANNAERNGLSVPEFSEPLQSKIKSKLPHTASWSNPIDITFDTNIFNLYLHFPQLLMKSGEIDVIIIYGAMGFGSIATSEQQNTRVSQFLKMSTEMSDKMGEMDTFLIPPTIKASHKYSVPVIYINPQSYANEWSKKIREHGGIVFQFWDRPVNTLAKICDYAKYRRKKPV